MATRLLEHRIAVVTGGSSGIGKAIAMQFAQHGAHVLILGTNSAKGARALQDIREQITAAQLAFYTVDVANYAAVHQAVDEILSSYGKVDILVNSAGITRDQLLLKMTEEEWDSVMATNVKSCYNTCHAIVRSMMKARYGRIINVGSVVGLVGNAGQANYAASKAAMVGFTKALAKELATRNISANVIAPGYIETPMTEGLTAEQKKAILDKVPLGRMGQPQEVAQVALFLASDMASYITGQVLVVDGGMAM